MRNTILGLFLYPILCFSARLRFSLCHTSANISTNFYCEYHTVSSYQSVAPYKIPAAVPCSGYCIKVLEEGIYPGVGIEF